MKIGILSDTHGNVEGGKLAARMLLENGAELIVHLGDCVEDALEIGESTGINIHCVAGNKDKHLSVATELSFKWEGVSVLALHGHRQGLNAYHDREQRRRSFEMLAAQAEELGAQIVLFGHTHLAQDFVGDGVRFINPGALDLGSNEKKCCLLDIQKSRVKTRFISL